MKNQNYIPFERNKYFYGKLLNVDDFETEQLYMNNKRRILNRFIHGCGIVCGMNTILVDECTLSIETGLALDFLGREIVIDTPTIKKVSMIDGFDFYTEEKEESSYLYLCIEYAEQEKDIVHSITGGKTGFSETEYNKIGENYRLYLTNAEPENMAGTADELFENSKTIYLEDGIQIKQILPNYAKENECCEMRIVVENKGQQPISFSYQVHLECLAYEGESDFIVSFKEEEYEKSSRYEKIYPLQVKSVKEVIGSVKTISESFKCLVGGRSIKSEVKTENKVQIIAGDIKRRIIEDYYHQAMEEVIRESSNQSIYLAKLFIIKAGNTYIVDQIETFPFSQYLYTNILAGAMNELTLREKSKNIKLENKNYFMQKQQDFIKDSFIASGAYIFNLGIGGKEGQKFFSVPITHGLGLGEVHIILGRSYSALEESIVVYGSQDIFQDKEAETIAELAAKVDIKNGSFIIGIKLLAPSLARQVKIDWIAIKNPIEKKQEKQERRIEIIPNMKQLTLRETYYMEAKLFHVADNQVKWSVKEEDGGIINENGMYTAPNKAGVYEIIAQSKTYPELKASAFVVVREKTKIKKKR